MTDLRTPLLDRIAALCAARTAPRFIVAVDGVDGAGKSIFAGALAQTLVQRGETVVQASIDGFHNPRSHRYRLGKTSAEGYFRDSYDYASFTDELIQPFMTGQSVIRTACFDHTTDQRVDRHATLPVRSTLVVDGIFLHRTELASFWDMSIFLAVPFMETYARMAIRDGCDPNPTASTNDRYLRGQMLYLETCTPSSAATIVIDNTNPAMPLVRKWRHS